MNELLIWGSVIVMYFVGLVLLTAVGMLVQNNYDASVSNHVNWLRTIRKLFNDK